jgi:lipopolysaccharide/colanic/teichoic acid biosynthesis glycosyltransferase
VAIVGRELELEHNRVLEAGAGVRWRDEPSLALAAKRVLDVGVALAMAAVLIIPALTIALLIRLDSRGPALLRQRRVGRYGRTFTVYKFRTMCERAEEMLSELLANNEQQGPLFKMRDDPRMTRVGRFLRKTSLDELPQLINVLRGEMSVVGPRPPLPREVEQYSLRERGRLAMKPGITGLWQVSGRSLLTWDQMVELDLQYIRRFSVAGDLAILVRTIPAVLTRRGAY